VPLGRSNIQATRSSVERSAKKHENFFIYHVRMQALTNRQLQTAYKRQLQQPRKIQCTNPFAIFGDEIDGFCLIAQSNQSDDVVVINSAEKVDFPTTFGHVIVAPRQQRLDHHQDLYTGAVRTGNGSSATSARRRRDSGLRQQYVSVDPFSCKMANSEDARASFKSCEFVCDVYKRNRRPCKLQIIERRPRYNSAKRTILCISE
jgi:hypothetical protein